MAVALITGASRGLGRALAGGLAERGWDLVLDARDPANLTEATQSLRSEHRVTAIAGDVTDVNHRAELAAAVADLGGANVLINNASTLVSSPMHALADLPAHVLSHLYATNVFAPLALTQLLLPQLLAHRGQIVNVTSDAAVEAYVGWGGYGSSKAALDQLSATLAAEQPRLSVYAFDPGDMRTELHQQAFPGDDISDRPEPHTVVPALVRLLGSQLPSGRYRARDLLVPAPQEVWA